MPRSRLVTMSWVVAIAFLAGTALTYVDRLNLVATPPVLPESSNMVDRAIGSAAYRQAIWPVFLWTNLAFAIGFAAAVAFAWLVSARSRVAGGLPLFTALATTGGIIAAIASLIPLGAVNAAVWQLYCDCGFKETEIIAGQWAGMVAMNIGDWFNRFGAVVLALALVALLRETGTMLSSSLRWWTTITAIALVAYPIMATTELPPDPIFPEVLTVAIGAVLVPIWSVWLGRSIDRAANANAPAGVEPSVMA